MEIVSNPLAYLAECEDYVGAVLRPTCFGLFVCLLNLGTQYFLSTMSDQRKHGAEIFKTHSSKEPLTPSNCPNWVIIVCLFLISNQQAETVNVE